MYSIVMMAALTTGADVTPPPVAVAAPAYAGCGGYSAGCGGYSNFSMSYSYANVGGCCGYSTGCCGYSYGHGHGRHSKHFGHKHSCTGFSYGCCGGYAGPYYGSCCGYGACYGSYSYSGGCGYMPPYGPFNIGGGCAGYYYQGGTMAPLMGAPVTAAPAVGYSAVTPAPAVESKTSAFLKFTLPAAAKLTVDGRPTAGEGTERSFYTPSLEPGRRFFYEVKAEMVVNGATVTEEKRVVVEAGADLRESFPKLLAAAAAKPDAVAAK